MMLREKQQAVNVGIGLGIACQLAGRFFLQGRPGMEVVTLIVLVAGAALFIYGCVNYALAKGQNGWLGLLGLLSIIGLIILVCLRDKYPDGRKPENQDDIRLNV
jgi:hypothetical protein